MKKIYTILAVLALTSLFGAGARAQQFQSGFFLDNYVYSYRYNPALMSEKGFLAIGAGDSNIAIKSDVGVSNFLFPNQAGNGLVTGLHSSVPSEQFLGGLKDITNIGLDFSDNVLGLGFRSDNTQTNIEVNVRGSLGLNLPKDLFAFVKDGTGNGPGNFDLTGFGIYDREYMEIAFGRARKLLNGHLVYGYRLKGLIGVADMSLGFDKAKLQVGADGVLVDIAAKGQTACQNVDLTTCNTTEGPDFSKAAVNTSTFTPSGYGWAVDLGVVGKFFNNCLTVSAGVLDLGRMSWNYNTAITTGANTAFYGLEDVSLGQNFDNVGDEFKSIGDDLSKLADLKFNTTSFEAADVLPWTLNFGVKLRVPFLRRLSFSGLYTHRNDINPWSDMRVAATFTPFNWLSVTANTGASTFGDVCGGAVSINLLGFNLHAGVDCYKGRVGLYNVEGVNIPKYGGVPFPVDPFRMCLNVGLSWQLLSMRRTDLDYRK